MNRTDGETLPEAQETRGINDLMLDWHAGASTIDMVAFRLWALAGLTARLGFEGAIWGLAGETGGAHFHRTEPAAIQGPEGERVLARLAAGPPGRVVRVEARPGGPADDAADVAHRHRHGLDSAIGVRFGVGVGDPAGDAGSGQFLALRRGAAVEPFDAHDCATFELLAPHMMLAFSTCRKLQLVAGAQRGSVRAAALTDRTGRIHESDARFVRTLRLEWADWVGRRLPDALVHHKSRKVASRWQFLGRQIAVDFAPVNEMTLVIARPRLPADALTAREWDIARRYAGGSEYKEVAEALQVSPATVRSHLRRVFSKLNVRNKAQLAASLG